MFTPKTPNINIPTTPPKEAYVKFPDTPRKTRARSVGMIRHDNKFQPNFSNDPEPNN